MKTLPIAVCAVLVTLAACTSSSSAEDAASPPGEESASTDSPSTTATPSSTPSLQEQPIQLARLSGTYNVKLYVTRSTYESKPDRQQVFKFAPKCDEGPCDAALSGNMSFGGAGADDRKSAGASNKFVVKLRTLGKKYEGFDSGYYGSCDGKPVKDRWTFAVSSERASYVDEVWTVTKWTGTWTRDSGSGGTCTPGYLKAVIRGSLQR